MGADIGLVVQKVLKATIAMRRSALVLENSVNKQADEVAVKCKTAIKNYVWKLASEKEFQDLVLKGSAADKKRRLRNLRKALKMPTAVETSTEVVADLAKVAKSKVPSATEIWNKKTAKLPGYVMYGKNGSIQKSVNKYAGMSDSEFKEAKKAEVLKDIRKRQKELLKKVGSSPTSSPPLNSFSFEFFSKGDPEAFRNECIIMVTENSGMSEPEAKEFCKNKLDEFLARDENQRRIQAIEADYDKKSQVPSAKQLFDEQRKKSKQWTEGHVKSPKEKGSRKKKR